MTGPTATQFGPAYAQTMSRLPGARLRQAEHGAYPLFLLQIYAAKGTLTWCLSSVSTAEVTFLQFLPQKGTFLQFLLQD